jgi:tetratricopeptide (TPR) repeat protein
LIRFPPARLRAATEALMASTARIDELKKKFDENPRRYFAPLANEFRKAGDIDQAIMICEEFLPQQPGHMSGHIVYGQALYEGGKLPEARTVFETALGLDPENLIALRHLGDIAHSQGESASARAWYVRVLDADPRNDEIQSMIATIDDDLSASTRFAAPPSESEAPSTEAPSFQAPDHGIPFLPPPVAEATPVPESVLIDGFSLEAFESRPEEPAFTESASASAEGFESTEFVSPTEPVASAADLDASLESGVPFFSTPEAPIAALSGLEGSGVGEDREEDAAIAEAIARSPFAPLDLDDDLLLSTSPSVADIDERDELLQDVASVAEPVESMDFGDPFGETVDFSGQESLIELQAAEVADADEATFEVPSELPPEVLAAEAALIDAGESPVPEAAFAAADVEAESPSELAVDVEPAPDDAGEQPQAEFVTHEESVSDELLVDHALLFEPAMDGETTPSAPEASEPEAELAPAFDDEESAPAPVAGTPFVTATMAELYLSQGFREQALAVYAQLLAADPSNEALQARVVALTPTEPVADQGPNVRDFFARMAARRPGTRAAAAAPPADDDFAPAEPMAERPSTPAYSESVGYDDARQSMVDAGAPALDESESEGSDLDPVRPAVERVAAMRTPPGSIDALFDSRGPGTSEDSAASALAQAFGATAEDAPEITGRPARTASAELSLDSVFRDGPARPRASQSFSFDQFFAEGTPGTITPHSVEAQPPQEEDAGAPERPAERSADDIEQFNTWLQGLKAR